MPVWVSLLCGVNLGARHRVSMPQLREALSGNGFGDVRTYLQSGNVVASSAHGSAADVAAAVHAVVREHFGIDTPVVVRTPGRLRAVLDWCPFPEAVASPTTLHVVHLAAEPPVERVEALLAQDWGPDAVAVRGTEAVIAYAATMHRSRLQHATVTRRLGVDGTARNWRTLAALVEMTAPPPGAPVARRLGRRH